MTAGVATAEVAVARREVDVVIAGAGFAGIGMGIRLRRRGRESFVILERADEVGGTWRDNSYPGVGSDVPAHVYSFSFRPPGDWASVFATGTEIRQYLQRAVDDEDLADHLRLGCELIDARWSAQRQRWLVETGDGPIVARVLITAFGRLTEPHTPDVPGLESFAGERFHTSRWRHDSDLDGARIGVVGTGASAVQVVPHLAGRAHELVVFSRSAPYVLPRNDRRYTDAERAELRTGAAASALREQIFADADTAFVQRRSGRPEIAEIRSRALGHLAAEVTDDRLRAQLTPDYEIGCKRIVFSDDWYRTLQARHVTVEPSALQEVRGSEAVAASGSRYRLDALILATGFDAARPTFARRITGRGDVTLYEHWSAGMVSYASTTVHGFPNMFVLDGPNAALGHNSAIFMIETQIDYVLGAVDHLAATGTAVIEVTAAAEDGYTREIERRSAGTVWMQGCRNWYVDAGTGRLTLLWPGTGASFRELNGTFDPGPYTRQPHRRRSHVCV
ncbi:flavin-containing monooxygenase [Williamsia sterculiae]|uniref:Predicted flavoprotein CzcO associated with the cation diffusion facilitator CzcD n=1 Tax=Williamsia sterculiae TaxID=1344003 RepID=A0A1N7FRN0_9NOCA|nr:NAD(P)/FAD-dependent oxidoreductase [Williamsia sterculiae]SIS03038.1 Predicted flavoprotein CzcO associated with the cation diffusion facilitator CzcD [Williamsia sterculiae]